MNYQGFSLVELLVTVAVLSIIATISVAQFQEYKAKANDATAMTHTINIYTAAHAANIEEALGDNPNSSYSISFLADGTSIKQGADSLSIENLVPGYKSQKDVFSQLQVWRTNSSKDIYMIAIATHCKGSKSTQQDYTYDDDGTQNLSTVFSTSKIFFKNSSELSENFMIDDPVTTGCL